VAGDRLPLDPDIDDGSRARYPWGVAALVFVGGCAGGLARYAATDHWPASATAFPWSTLGVNAVGAFVLALLLAVVTRVGAPNWWTRPLVGTGFCGAFTTFGSVVVSVDRLVAHAHAATGLSYLAASVVGGLGAAALGFTAGHLLVARRRAA
jgi:CrcB protein